MTANISFQPYVQSGGNAGLFNASSTGLRQGTAYADPSTRYRLRAGLLATTETLPMWGGVGIYADVPGGSGNPSYALGTIVGRAVSLADASKPLNGFSVFDEAYGMITSPQSPVPLAGPAMQVNWYPLGSLARIVVAADPSLISLRGTPISSSVAWDFTNQRLVPYLGTLTITSGTYNNTTGVITLVMSTSVTFSAGDSVTLATLTGTGGYATLDGTWTVLTASGTGVTLAGPAGAGASTITGGNLTVGGAASQALAVKVLDVQATNCETVSYSSTTGFATWGFDNAAAVIQL